MRYTAQNKVGEGEREGITIAFVYGRISKKSLRRQTELPVCDRDNADCHDTLHPIPSPCIPFISVASLFRMSLRLIRVSIFHYGYRVPDQHN